MPLKEILIFGGNGFLGAATAECMLYSKQFSLTLVNRGRDYWHWQDRVLPSDINHIIWDRKQHLSKCELLAEKLKETHFDAVIDFSAYNGHDVEEAIGILHEKVDLYVYISSDSVYEVCEKNHGGPTKESDALRPKSKTEQSRLKKSDSYGHKKLRGEEALQQGQKKWKLKYVVLRLADVIGPRDSTDRWWMYQVWLHLAVQTGLPVLVPAEWEDVPLSFVYVDDVAQLICNILNWSKESICEISGESFNLAFDKTFSLAQLLRQILSEMKEKDVLISASKSTEVPQVYPSVEKGCVDITKAKAMLGWSPIEWTHAVKQTTHFYETVTKDAKFHDARLEVYKALYGDLKLLFDRTIVKNTLKEILSLAN